MRSSLLIGLVAVLGLVSSCSSEKLYASNRGTLQAAIERMESGDLKGAEQSVKSVLVMTGETPGDYALQRYFAEYLLSQIHMSAFVGQPYLVVRGGEQGGFDAMGNRLAAETSPLGHLVAANYHAAYGRDAYPSVREAPLQVDGEPLLPPSLADLGVQNALIGMNLATLTGFARLRFEDSVASFLNSMPGVLELDSCDELLENARVSHEIEPWVYLALHEQLRARDAREAFRFAVRALHGRPGVSTAKGLSQREREDVHEWILEGAEKQWKISFYCTDCREEIDPILEQCLGNCGRPAIEFEALTTDEVEALEASG